MSLHLWNLLLEVFYYLYLFPKELNMEVIDRAYV